MGYYPVKTLNWDCSVFTLLLTLQLFYLYLPNYITNFTLILPTLTKLYNKLYNHFIYTYKLVRPTLYFFQWKLFYIPLKAQVYFLPKKTQINFTMTVPIILIFPVTNKTRTKWHFNIYHHIIFSSWWSVKLNA